jgi:hypothetical protein
MADIDDDWPGLREVSVDAMGMKVLRRGRIGASRTEAGTS